MIYFLCSKCKEVMEAPASLVNTTLNCPKCAHVNIVPKPRKKRIIMALSILAPIAALIIIGIVIILNNNSKQKDSTDEINVVKYFARRDALEKELWELVEESNLELNHRARLCGAL